MTIEQFILALAIIVIVTLVARALFPNLYDKPDDDEFDFDDPDALAKFDREADELLDKDSRLDLIWVFIMMAMFVIFLIIASIFFTG